MGKAAGADSLTGELLDEVEAMYILLTAFTKTIHMGLAFAGVDGSGQRTSKQAWGIKAYQICGNMSG
jgi:hypothetical protein